MAWPFDLFKQPNGATPPIMGGMLGQVDTSRYGGLFDPETLKALQAEAAQKQKRALGISLLQAAAPNPVKQSFAGGLGNALAASQGVGDDFMRQQVPLAMMGRQFAEQKAAKDAEAQWSEMIAKGDLKGAAALNPAKTKQYVDATAIAGGAPPSNVAEWQFYETLSPADQKRFLEMKRGVDAAYRDVGGVPTQLVPGEAPKPLSTPEAEAEAKRRQAAAAAAGTAAGEKQGAAQIALPEVKAQIGSMVAMIDQLEKHPGFTSVVGAKGPTGFLNFGKPIPGSDAAGAQALVDQIKGGAFLQAFEKLKGGGAIQQAEGEKATAAMARLDQAQSEQDYKAALADLKSALSSSVARAEVKAGSVQRARNPQTGQIIELRDGKWVPVDGK